MQVISNGTGYSLEAGPTVGTDATGGMNWTATVDSPVPALFGDGSLMLVQIAVPNRTITITQEEELVDLPWSLKGKEGLDSIYPYPWITNAPLYSSQDLPRMDLDFSYLQSAEDKDQFFDYLMYFAPGTVQCVPLARLVLSISSDVSLNLSNSGSWSDFPTSSAGTITPGSTRATFLPFNEFPMWSQIIIPNNDYSGY